jgi:hypothetical protein
MTSTLARQIAQRIADDLFVNGEGVEAERLVLWLDSQDANLGGWSKRAVIDRIVKVLVDFRPSTRKGRFANSLGKV